MSVTLMALWLLSLLVSLAVTFREVMERRYARVG